MEFFTYKNTEENAKKVENAEKETKSLRARKLFFSKKEKYDESKHDQTGKISLPVKDYE